MPITFAQVMRPSDWVKIFILLGAALVAWYYVYQSYTTPFELPDDIRRQQMIREFEAKDEEPLFAPTP